MEDQVLIRRLEVLALILHCYFRPALGLVSECFGSFFLQATVSWLLREILWLLG